MGWRRIALRYTVAVAAFAVVGSVRWALIPIWGSAFPFITYYPAIMASAWYGGLWPGLVTTTLGAVATMFFLLPPIGSFYVRSGADMVGLGVFLLNGVMISSVIEALHRTRRRRDEALERQLEARAEAEAANRAKDDFLATLSHELRTPLTAILGWVHTLRTRQLPPERMAHALEIIHRNTLQQAKLIDDLLDVSRIEAGKLELDQRPVDLAAVVADAVESLRRDVEIKNIDLRPRIDPLGGLVLGDRARLQQIVSNLLANAVKFTPDGGRVEVELDREGPHARVVIRDNGAGIGPEALPHVFERFLQAGDAPGRKRGALGNNPPRTRGGLGLGLSIVRHLVDAHGGTVGVESAGPGQGTTVIVKLPIMAVRLDQLERVRARDTAPRLDGVSVLLVEDDADSAELLETVLREQGAAVTIARTGEEALGVLRASTPDVLVSDIGLPDLDGYALIGRLRDLERRQRRRFVPGVAVTAFASRADHERALAAGFQSHTAKPVEPDELVEVVAKAVGRVGA